MQDERRTLHSFYLTDYNSWAKIFYTGHPDHLKQQGHPAQYVTLVPRLCIKSFYHVSYYL